MKALSIRQPWAELILQGRKTLELRSWTTHYRGRIYIHAAKQINREACQLYGFDPCRLARGALVGSVEILNTTLLTDERYLESRQQHMVPYDWPGSMCAWELAKPQRFPHPVPLKGKLGLFDVDNHALQDHGLVSWYSQPIQSLQIDHGNGYSIIIPVNDLTFFHTCTIYLGETVGRNEAWTLGLEALPFCFEHYPLPCSKANGLVE